MTLRLTFHRPAERLSLLTVYSGLALGGLLVARFIPIAKWMQPWWGCPLRRMTGVPCLGCGLTRAFDWEAHGHFLKAFALTPLGALAPIACALVAAYGLSVLAFRAPVPDLEVDAFWSRVLRYGFAAVVLANWTYMVATRHLHS